jgi:hypothetical protein
MDVRALSGSREVELVVPFFDGSSQTDFGPRDGIDRLHGIQETGCLVGSSSACGEAVGIRSGEAYNDLGTGRVPKITACCAKASRGAACPEETG